MSAPVVDPSKIVVDSVQYIGSPAAEYNAALRPDDPNNVSSTSFHVLYPSRETGNLHRLLIPVPVYGSVQEGKKSGASPCKGCSFTDEEKIRMAEECAGLLEILRCVNERRAEAAERYGCSIDLFIGFSTIKWW